MHFIVKGELDARLEALRFLERWQTQDKEQPMWRDMAIDCAEYGRKMNLNEEEYGAMLRPLEEAYAFVIAEVPEMSAQTAALFARVPAAQMSLAQAMLLTKREEERAAGEDVRRLRMQCLLNCMLPDFEPVKDDEAADLDDFLSRVDRLELAEAEKYRCVRAALDFDAQYAALDAVLERAARRVEAQKKALQPLVERWQAHYGGREDADLEAELAQVGIRMEGDTCELTPCCSAFATLSVRSLREGKGPERMAFEVGALLDVAILRLGAEENDARRLAGDLKAMGDPARMSILRALSDGEKYAQELTALVGLTPATVSYHMSELMGRDLVEAKKRGTRLYYALRREKLARVAQALERL